MRNAEPVKLRFFISRAGEDSQWAIWITNILETEGHTCIVQDYDIKPGHSFVHQMKLAEDQADHVIVVLSQNYLSKEFTLSELYAAIAADSLGERRFLIPVRIDHCEIP